MMNISNYYAGQAEFREVGADIDGRVKKAARLFQKHLGRAERLLDIGCGVGGVGLYLQEVLSAKEVYGVEISESRVAAAQQRGIKAVQRDFNQEPLPFDDNSFDAIFCGEIIEHLVDPDHLLDEIHRALTPQGVCVLTTPNLANWYNRIALALGWQPFDTSVSFRHEVGRPKFLVGDYGCRDHLRVFTYRALRELLSVHDFTVVDVAGVSLSEVFVGRGDWSSKPTRALLFWALYPLDRLLSLSTSLGTRVVVAFKKR
ncbi:MAG: class I SAM-dependent methyltransferase [Dehalococcoidia bacterium]|nr:class I SAM-dependent methyltransferase [Dehalococcoidia bacterium]